MISCNSKQWQMTLLVTNPITCISCSEYLYNGFLVIGPLLHQTSSSTVGQILLLPHLYRCAINCYMHAIPFICSPVIVHMVLCSVIVQLCVCQNMMALLLGLTYCLQMTLFPTYNCSNKAAFVFVVQPCLPHAEHTFCTLHYITNYHTAMGL